MQNKTKKFWLGLWLVGFCVFFCVGKTADLREKKLKFLQVLASIYPFSQGADARQAPETLGQYFTSPIYKRLTGNDLLGFQYDEGFVFSGKGFQLKECKTISTTARFEKPFLNAMQETLRLAGWRVSSPTECQLGIGLVAVVEKMDGENLPGVVLEVYAKNVASGKKLFLRIKSGSRLGWYEGMKNAWRYICLILQSSEGNGQKRH